MGRLRSLLSTRVDGQFGIDLRALPAFRIARARLLLFGLASRARFLPASYTAAGVLPRIADLTYHARDGLPTAYVCRRYVCQAPTTDPADLARQIEAGV